MGEFIDGSRREPRRRVMIHTLEYPFPGLAVCLGQINGMALNCLLAVGSREELGQAKQHVTFYSR